MTGVVRSLFRTTTQDAPTSQAEPLDYCECSRGVVVGAVIAYADHLLFFPLSNKKAEYPDNVVYLRCIDCLTDLAMDVATGAIEERMKEWARKRGAEMDALMRTNAMRREAGLPAVSGFIPEGCDEWPTGGER